MKTRRGLPSLFVVLAALLLIADRGRAVGALRGGGAGRARRASAASRASGARAALAVP